MHEDDPWSDAAWGEYWMEEEVWVSGKFKVVQIKPFEDPDRQDIKVLVRIKQVSM